MNGSDHPHDRFYMIFSQSLCEKVSHTKAYIYRVIVPQPPAESVSQPAGRGNIIATNLSLILADKNQKIPDRVSISCKFT